MDRISLNTGHAAELESLLGEFYVMIITKLSFHSIYISFSLQTVCISKKS